MKAMPTEDEAFGRGSTRIDGRGVFPAYLFEVQSPAESKYPWDYYKLLATTPGPEAIRPLKETGCSLVKRRHGAVEPAVPTSPRETGLPSAFTQAGRRAVNRQQPVPDLQRG